MGTIGNYVATHGRVMVFVERSYSLIGRFVRQLIAIVEDVSFLTANSHVGFIRPGDVPAMVDASLKGVRAGDPDYYDHRENDDCEVKYFELINADQPAIVAAMNQHLGDGYSFAYYMRRYFRVTLFYCVQVLLVMLGIGLIWHHWWPMVIVSAFSGILIGGRAWLKRADMRSEDCKELVLEGLIEGNLISWPMGKRNGTPDMVLALLETLEIHGLAKLVAEKRLGEKTRLL